ncbi:helix-turn-helix domain-containing protein [Dactylosporangium sp. CA-152071]|uniref:helix-turn-helix domain-containing protein n=1 Tax=Dactylosporangium sp. CA-152071 TaxID=3239933 RepID=UPI003D8E5CAB
MSANEENLSDVIARRIVRIRKSRSITREQLAERCAQLGYPALTGPAVANIETGRRGPKGERRRDITVDELTVLAAALDVPPIMLAFPIGTDAESPVVPRRRIDTWDAARWFMGDLHVRDDGRPAAQELESSARPLITDGNAWNSAATPIELYRSHDALMSEYHDVLIGRLYPPDEDERKREKELARATAVLFRLREKRAEMRRHGLTPPELAADERHIDEKRHVFMTPEQADAYAAEHPGDLKFVDWAALRTGREYRPGDGARIREAQEFAQNFESDADASDDGDSDS